MLSVLHFTAIGVLCLLGLAVAGLVLYKRVRALMRTVGSASARIGELTNELNTLQSKASARP